MNHVVIIDLTAEACGAAHGEYNSQEGRIHSLPEKSSEMKLTFYLMVGQAFLNTLKHSQSVLRFMLTLCCISVD